MSFLTRFTLLLAMIINAATMCGNEAKATKAQMVSPNEIADLEVRVELGIENSDLAIFYAAASTLIKALGEQQALPKIQSLIVKYARRFCDTMKNHPSVASWVYVRTLEAAKDQFPSYLSMMCDLLRWYPRELAREPFDKQQESNLYAQLFTVLYRTLYTLQKGQSRSDIHETHMLRAKTIVLPLLEHLVTTYAKELAFVADWPTLADRISLNVNFSTPLICQLINKLRIDLNEQIHVVPTAESTTKMNTAIVRAIEEVAAAEPAIYKAFTEQLSNKKNCILDRLSKGTVTLEEFEQLLTHLVRACNNDKVQAHEAVRRLLSDPETSDCANKIIERSLTKQMPTIEQFTNFLSFLPTASEIAEGDVDHLLNTHAEIFRSIVLTMQKAIKRADGEKLARANALCTSMLTTHGLPIAFMANDEIFLFENVKLCQEIADDDFVINGFLRDLYLEARKKRPDDAVLLQNIQQIQTAVKGLIAEAKKHPNFGRVNQKLLIKKQNRRSELENQEIGLRNERIRAIKRKLEEKDEKGNLQLDGVQIFDPTEITTRFDDIAGQQEAVSALKDTLDFFRNRYAYERLAKKSEAVDSIHGILFYGPPGNGKTYLAKAAAGELGLPFIVVSGASFSKRWCGFGAEFARQLFALAREIAPCVLFIDEIDAVGGARSGDSGGDKEKAIVINQILVEVDGFAKQDPDKQVILMGATNRADSLDPAFVRSGRFDRKIQFSELDVPARIHMLQRLSRNYLTAQAINWDDIAKRTNGWNGADLALIFRQAFSLAGRARADEITQEYLLKALEMVAKERVAGKENNTQESAAQQVDTAIRLLNHEDFGPRIVQLLPEKTMRRLAAIMQQVIGKKSGDEGEGNAENINQRIARFNRWLKDGKDQ